MTTPAPGSADVVWVDVLPSLARFTATLRAGLQGAVGQATASGRTAGTAWGAAFGTSAADAVASAQGKVALASKRMADAAGAVTVQQEKLNAARASGTASADRLVAAEEAVEKAQRNAALMAGNYARELQRLDRAQAVQASEAEGAAAKNGLFARTMGSTEVAAGRMTRAMDVVGKAMIAAFAVDVGVRGIVKLIDTSQSFDAQMKLVQTQAGATGAEVAKMQGPILALAGKVAQAPEALALSLYHVESVGLRGAKALDTVAASARFATVAHADLEETTNALTAAVASGIPGVQNLDEAVGALNATVGSGDMKLSDLNAALGSGLLAVVKGYGLSIRDVGAALATFGDNNIRGAQAATFLRMAVQALAVPAAKGVKDLEAIGITQHQLADDMQKGGLNKAIVDLKEHLDKAGITGDKVGAILTEAFGKRAGPGLAVLLEQFTRLQSKYGEITKASHDFSNEWTVTTHTAYFAFQSLKDQLQSVFIQIGNAVLPVLSRIGTAVAGFFSDMQKGKGVAGEIGRAFQSVGKLISAVFTDLKPLLSTLWTGFLSSIGAVIIGMGKVADFLTKHKILVSILAGALGGLIAKFILFKTVGMLVAGVMALIDVAMDANPIGLVAIALGALVGAFIYAYNHFKSFRDVANTVWDALKVGFDWVKTHWQLLLEIIAPPILWAIELITHWGQIWKAVTGAFKTAWDAVSGAFVSAWNTVWGALKKAYDTVTGAFVGAWKATVGGFKTAWDAVAGALTSAWNTFWHGLTAVVSVVTGTVAAAWHGVTVAWDGVVTAIKAVWDHVLHPVWNVMMDIAKIVGLVIGDLILVPVAAAWVGIQFVIKHAWENVIKPAWAALQAAAEFMWTHVLMPIWDAIQKAWSFLWNAMKTDYENVVLPVWHALQAAAEFMWTHVLKPVWDAIQKAWSFLWNAMKTDYENVVLPVWHALQAAAETLWHALVAVWNAVKRDTEAIWTAFTGFLSGLWHAFTGAIAAAAKWVWTQLTAASNGVSKDARSIWTQLTQFLGGLWHDFTSGIVAAAQWLWHTLVGVFNTLKTDASRIWQGIVDGIKTIWTTVEEAVGTPINWFIHYVVNDGLIKAWNWATSHLGLGKLSVSNMGEIGPPAHQFADGGYTGPGMFGTNSKYDPAGVVHAGEFVHTQETTKKFRPLFEAIHSGAIHSMADLAKAAMGGYANGGLVKVLPGYAGGGFTYPALENWVYGNVPGAVITSAYRPGSHDYHGLGEAIDISFPGNPQSRLEPLAARIAATFGGITELIHNPNESIKNGAVVPPGFWGASTWAEHASHVHWAMTPDALANAANAVRVGGVGGGPGFGGAVAGFFGDLWHSATDVFGDLTKAVTGPVSSFLSKFNSPFMQSVAKMPLNLLGKMWDSIKDRVVAFFSNLGSTVAGVGDGGVTPGSELAIKQQAFQIAGAAPWFWNSAAQQQGLDYIATHESGWNPHAQNPSSSASGIWQQIDSTWAASRPPQAAGYAHMKDAPSNLQDEAGFRYILRAYGDPVSASNYWRANHYYADGGYVHDTGGLWPTGTASLNLTGGTERVLTPPQDNYFQRFVAATEGNSAPSQFVGNLYLDSGEFMGKVTGVAVGVLNGRNATLARDLRSAK